MNGMYLSGKPGIVHAMQMPRRSGSRRCVHPAAQRHVALHHRALAAELDEAAVVVAVLVAKLPISENPPRLQLLANGPLEEPLRPEGVVERDHWRQPAELEHE